VQTGEWILFLLVAGGAGSLMAIQGSINSLLGENIGLLPMSIAINTLGLITAAIFLIFFPPPPDLMKKIMATPLYSWLGGPIGVAIIFGVAVAIPKLGVGVATTGIIFLQLLTAYLIDHFGLFGQEHYAFTWWKSLGILLMVTGSYLLLKK